MVITKVELKEYGSSYHGKHNGWAYQFLNDNYEGIHLGVCCKDYLQDIVWSELTQKTMKIYGQTSTYLGILDKQERLKLCIYPYVFQDKKEPIIDNIDELSINLESFLNEIEVLKDFDLSSVFTSDNKIIIEFSKQWIDKPYLLSMFTLFLRIGVYYNGDLNSFMVNYHNPNNIYSDICDSYSLKNNGLKLLDIINNKAFIEQKNWIEIDNPSQVHNSGIFSNIYNIKYNGTN